MPFQFFAHLTWATLDRRPMITASVARLLSRFLPAEAKRHGAKVIAMGIVVDHVHLVVRMPRVVDFSRLVQGFKGASARAVNESMAISTTGLRWARGYDARSVGLRDLPRAIEYVRGQAARHPDRAIPNGALQGPSPQAPSREFSRGKERRGSDVIDWGSDANDSAVSA